jgi:poly-gamma-glutamate synthesis protein (capsule biosynthesis protein)
MSTTQLFKILCNKMGRKINKRSISRIMPFFILLSAFAMPTTSFAKAGKSTDKEITIVMVGDILLHTPVEEAAKDDAGNYNFDFIFEDTKKDIAFADIAIVNQEVIIGGEELGVSGYPAFNAPTEIGDALVRAGFDVVCHGTNHALDKGKKGILNTLDYWEENHPEITILGINDSKEDQENITIIEQDGIKIALLNYTYGTNGISLPKGMSYAVDMLDKDKVISDLKYAEENADFTIVCPHWGTEYELGTDSSQKKWAKIFREYGADLVIGTHPHVIEPIEMMEDDSPGYSNNHGNGDMLVYYSLGNFVNWTSGKGKGVANRMVGGMAQISIGLDKNGEVVIKDYGVEALVCHVKSGDRNIRVCPLSSYSEAMGLENEIRKQDSTFSTQYCIDLVNSIWKKLWR